MCRAFTTPIIRLTAEDYLKRAQEALSHALTDYRSLSSALLDLIRAYALVSGWLWAQNRDAEVGAGRQNVTEILQAVVMSSNAVR